MGRSDAEHCPTGCGGTGATCPRIGGALFSGLRVGAEVWSLRFRIPDAVHAGR
ncbi:MAG: hypothetical protein V8Q84_03290 [Bilophila sp.]